LTGIPLFNAFFVSNLLEYHQFIIDHKLPQTRFVRSVFFADSINHHCDVIDPQMFQIRWNDAKLPPCRSRSFKVTNFVTNGSPYATSYMWIKIIASNSCLAPFSRYGGSLVQFSLWPLFNAVVHKFKIVKFGRKKLETSLYGVVQTAQHISMFWTV